MKNPDGQQTTFIEKARDFLAGIDTVHDEANNVVLQVGISDYARLAADDELWSQATVVVEQNEAEAELRELIRVSAGFTAELSRRFSDVIRDRPLAVINQEAAKQNQAQHHATVLATRGELGLALTGLIDVVSTRIVDPVLRCS